MKGRLVSKTAEKPTTCISAAAVFLEFPQQQWQSVVQ